MVKKENKILITGSSSKISEELLKILPKKSNIKLLSKNVMDMSNLTELKDNLNFFLNFDTIIFLHGKLLGKEHNDKTSEEILDQIKINLLSIIEICEFIIKKKKRIKIIILGSESGIKGSYDKAYFLSKSALHHYIKEKKIKYSHQQIIGIAPSMIKDGNMTTKRKNKKEIISSKLTNPKKRLLTSKEIAKLIKYLVFDLSDYISNIVIGFDGGKFSRMD